jgi:hypothetical protein
MKQRIGWLLTMLGVVWFVTMCCFAAGAQARMPYAMATYNPDGTMDAPAIAVTIPLAIVSTPNAEQDIIQPGTTFLVVNRLEVTDLLDYVGTISGNISGNAATATALATTPNQCLGGFFATGIAPNGNANCSNAFPTGGVSFNSIYISGATRSYLAQGAYLNWNITGGGGESDFVNNKGAGAGGYSWYNATSAGINGTPIMTLDAIGVLTPANGVNAIATTADQLAGTPTQCGAGNVSTGIQANGDSLCVPVGASVQFASNLSPCTTAASSYSTCNSTVSWPTAFTSNSYGVYCMGVTPSNGRAAIQGLTSQNLGNVVVSVVTEGSVAVTFGKISCIGVL